ncbi:hypothetical protein MFIFM68171_05974 [Madurella fahalii]|uniref:Prion-inhibition and propagation HeLo domain-containing protein n=1 Tax=Madurella fahalii TaxID=1157608 RepID=A0ABQ0GDJ1_9PEZI
MELAAGVVSLTWDVFDSTIRMFKFISALVEMPKECEKYRLQLIIEYNRVLAWGKAAGLVDSDGSTLAATLGTNSIELVGIVARIQCLLAEFRDLNARYNNEVPAESYNNEPSTDRDVLKEISNLALSYEREKKERSHLRGTNHIREFFENAGRRTKEILTHPARVRWVAVDKEAFEALLKDLHALTERLYELMSAYRARKIDDIIAGTYREMILARNDIQDLWAMFDAVSGLINASADTRKERDAYVNHKTLQDLVRLKKLSRISESILSKLGHDGASDADGSLREIGITVRKYSASELEHFEWNESTFVDAQFLTRPRGILSIAEDTAVWVEWKSLPDAVPNSLRDKESILRTVALAEMLHLPKPASLHVPECIGYFDDREFCCMDRLGWIFKMPAGSDFNTLVVPLYDLLGDDRFKPSLSQRVTLASKLCSTVLDLHAVDWLHKGIFSDNVIFHLNGEDGLHNYDPEKPLLTGFEFSRPDGTQTTARDTDTIWDLYRWPGIQREKPTERNSKKTYDLYSLGLVLLEVAHWKKLHRVMRLGQKNREGPKEHSEAPMVPLEKSKMVRDWLLGIRGEGDSSFAAAGKPNPLKELRNIVGDRYWKAVERCLWAHGEKGFGVEELADQSNDSSVGIMLQEAFTKHVVEELRSIHL